MTLPLHEILRVRIDGDPVGKGRPRFNPRSSRPYRPAKTRAWTKRAAELLALAWRRDPVTVPVAVDVVAVKRRPGRLPKRHPGRVLRVAKPDEDNVRKVVLDALTRARVYTDDACVVAPGPESASWYAALGEPPHVEVVVYVVTATTWASGSDGLMLPQDAAAPLASSRSAHYRT